MNTQSFEHQADPLNRARLRWRARRGLLENDLVLTRFFDKHEHDLSDEDVNALTQLFDLPDTELLDLILARKEPEDNLQHADFKRVIDMLRNA
jgi:antitoxin CptB